MKETDQLRNLMESIEAIRETSTNEYTEFVKRAAEIMQRHNPGFGEPLTKDQAMRNAFEKAQSGDLVSAATYLVELIPGEEGYGDPWENSWAAEVAFAEMIMDLFPNIRARHPQGY